MALSPQFIFPNQQPLSEVYFMWERENNALRCYNSEDVRISVDQFRNILPHEQFIRAPERVAFTTGVF